MAILFILLSTDLEASWHWALSDKSAFGEAITSEDKSSLVDIECAYIHVIVNGMNVVMKHSTLDGLNDKYTRQAIGFSIEDELAQPVSNIHIGFDENMNRLAVVSNEYMQDILAVLEAFSISPKLITADYDSVMPKRFCYDGRLIESSDTHLGYAVERSNADRFMDAGQTFPEQIDAQAFFDMIILANKSGHKPINLKSGIFADNHAGGLQQFKRSGILAAACAAVFMMYNLGYGYYYHHKTKSINAEIEQIYSRMFPKQKIPARPVQQTLEARRNTANGDTDVFIKLSGILMTSVKTIKSVEINSLRYNRDKAQISITVFYEDFNDVDSLRQNVIKNGGVFLEGATRQNNAGISGNAIIRLGS